MQVLKGKVASGHGVATRYFDHVMNLIETRSGLTGLHPGTLNLLLREHFPIEEPDAMISRVEFNMKNQWIKLKRCQLLGIDAVIIRPERHDDPKRTDLYYRLELMAQCQIRSTFGLGDGDDVTVTVP